METQTQTQDQSSVAQTGQMMMAYGWSDQADEVAAVEAAYNMMMQGLAGANPKFITIFTTGKKQDQVKIFTALKVKLDPSVKIWGLNSDLDGIALPNGMRPALAIMGFNSPDLVVGVGTAKLDWKDSESYGEVGKKAVQAALADAGKQAGEAPKILFFAGLNLITDIDIYKGIQEVIGEVPICGGNTGQHTGELIPGDGFVFSTDGAETDSISIALMWMSSKVGVAYGYGYTEHPEHKGTVTKSDPKKRIVYEIDNRPAADVYNEWTGGQLTDFIKNGGGMVPLPIIGRFELKKPFKKGSEDYVAVAFTEIYPDKSAFVTHEGIEEGTELTLMELSKEQDVVNKPTLVGTVARNRGGIAKEDVAGAILVYCYALLYTAKGSGYDVNPSFPLLSNSLNDAPFIGFFSGGEIGFSPNFKNEGNRMMAFSNVLAVFGKH